MFNFVSIFEPMLNRVLIFLGRPKYLQTRNLKKTCSFSNLQYFLPFARASILINVGCQHEAQDLPNMEDLRAMFGILEPSLKGPS